nr:hypothetical protein [Tanacetum cinerariifolium]
MPSSIHNKPIYSVSIIIHFESALEHDVSAKSKVIAGFSLSAPKDSISQTIGKGASDIAKKIEEEFNTSSDLSSFEDTQKEIKLKDLSKLVQDVRVDFMDLDSPNDNEPIIVQDESDEEVHAEKAQNHKLEKQKSKAEAEVAFLTAQPSYPNMTQFTELLVTSLKPESSHLLSSHDFGSLLPTELKELPYKFNELTKEVKELKKHVYDLEIELLGDLKEIPTKLGTFTSIVKSLTTQVAKLKTLQISPQLEGGLIKKDKDKKAMSLKDAKEESSDSEYDDANITGSRVESSKEQEKLEDLAKADRAKQEVVLGKEELVDLLGIHVVTKYYKAKFQYEKYCDKLLNKRAQLIITNCDVLTRKGPITLKVYREDGIDEDHLDKLNDLEKKKRKSANDINDYFKDNKRLKSSIQYENHPAGTVLNESVLGMILFNSFNRQDFVTIKDFGDFPNEMLYTVQEIFFRLHQGLGLDDHARTFSSLLLVEVDKKNTTPSSK